MTEPSPPAGLVHRGLERVEFFDLSSGGMENLPSVLASMATEGRGEFSFHAPVHRPDWFPWSGVTCFYLCEDGEKWETSFRLLEHTLREASRLGAAYVVSHLTFGPTDTKDEARARILAEVSLARMADMSRSFAMPIDIEFAAYSDSFHDPSVFARMVGGHGELGVCIDVGHACLGAIRRGRDLLDDIRSLAPITRSLHLWNTTGPEHTKTHHHTPLHPSQTPEDGWIDIPAVLNAVRAHNPDVRVIFEYPVAKVTPEIQAGYDWVGEIMAIPA